MIENILSTQTTFNTQDSNIGIQKQQCFELLTKSDNLYEQSAQCLDDSFEMKILSKSHPENIWIQIEQSIVTYLKQLGIKMKTDPLEKREHFYKKPKRRMQKSSTVNFNTSNQEELTDKECENKGSCQKFFMEMNSIKQRRTPNVTPQSSPLITKKVDEKKPIKQQRMSIFKKMQKQGSISSNDGEIQDNIQVKQNEENSDNEKDYFQKLCE